MATLRIYHCEKCGYEVQTESSGKYALMSGMYQNFECKDCKEIVSVNIDNSVSNIKCPDCGADGLTPWKPTTGKCPKCGGKMKKVKDYIIMAD